MGTELALLLIVQNALLAVRLGVVPLATRAVTVSRTAHARGIDPR